MFQITFGRVTAVLTAAMLTTFTFSTPTLAQSAEVAEASLRINIAGRQRMLSQRMSKAACFAHIGVDVEAHKAMLDGAVSQFALSHKALRYGDADLGLKAEEVPATIAALALVDREWNNFSETIESIAAEKRKTRDQIAALDAAGLSLASNMNDAVFSIVSGYGDLLDDLPIIQSITIDITGRQRMLTQKAAKEFCLIEYGVDADANRANLAETITLFSDTLEALINGVPGMVNAPPNDAVLAKLNEVKAEWAAPYAMLLDISNGAQACCEQPREISAQTEKVLVLLNEAVKMYETAQ